jgi:hypothetical protein
LKNVAVLGSTFTSPTAHNLRVKDVLWFLMECTQGIFYYSTTVFVVTNDAVGAFGFVGNVTVSADFSSRFEKVLILCL